MKRDNWEITNNTGYTFVFEHRDHPSIELKIFAKNEEEAWKKLEQLK